MIHLNKVVRLGILLTLIVGAFGMTNAQDMEFEGVTIDILTFTGPQIAEPLQRRAPEFQELTGAQVNIVTVPFSDLYQNVLTDQATGTNSFDAFVFAPQWMVDYIDPGYLEPLTGYVEADESLMWDDVAPFFRNFSSTYQGDIYTIPLDGDFHMVYYRIDVLEELGLEPPQTWEDYLAIAEAADDIDMNDDGEGDYGSCIGKARANQGYWFVHSIAGGFLQTQGTSEGAFFDTEDMTPLINNPAFIRAMEIYAATTEFGPPDELNIGVGDTRNLFQAGRCALTLDWGDVGSLSIDPDNSVVKDITGAVILPGTTEVLDRESGELVACDDMTCPFAIDGVNHAPFAAFGGWSGGISAAAPQEVKDATYAFFSYMAQPAQANVDVTIGATGFNPYRTSQFEGTDTWVEAGFSEEGANEYLSAIGNSLASPNMMLDLRIPQNQRYQGVVLDTVLSQFLAGEFTAEEAAEEIELQWEEITDELGRDAQLAAYLGTLGIETE
ncbi:MAG: extracellular solute-binding protein [Chloroflexota bacterium]